jgi:hypothetical protein
MIALIMFVLGSVCGYLVYDALAQYQDYRNLQYLDKELADYYKENDSDRDA